MRKRKRRPVLRKSRVRGVEKFEKRCFAGKKGIKKGKAINFRLDVYGPKGWIVWT